MVLALIAVAGWLVHNTLTNLSNRGIIIGFDFLGRAARFPVSESLLPYDPTDSFGWAFVVGLGNTLFITVVVAVLSSVLGLLVALARGSRHPFAYALSSAFVDAIRNAPLVVQLLFWYALVTFGLPHSAEAIHPLPGVFLTDRGLYVPQLVMTGVVWPAVVILILGLGGAVLVSRADRRQRLATGVSPKRTRIMLALTAVLVTGAALAGGTGMEIGVPELGRFNFMGGLTLTPEFVAVMLGLTLYSTAFSAEVIRAGIDAVPRGQKEAARALGLSGRQTLRLVVLPQALQIVIPPMTSQYINILKNSTLALVVGYPELNFITATTINQTGQALEGIAILMAIFLTISLVASLMLNRYDGTAKGHQR